MTGALEKGLERFRAGDPKAAAAHARGALVVDPANAEARHLLGLALFHLGDLAESISQFRRAVLLAPANASAWLNLAVALRKDGRLAEAEEAIQEALSRDPQFAGAWFNLGNLCLEGGRWGEAEAAYRRALAADPDDPRPPQNLAVALKSLGRAAEAVVVLARALAAQPDNAGVLNNLGNLLREDGRADEAVALLEKAAALAPQSPDVAYNLGAALAAEDRQDEAAAHYEKAVALRPAFTKARWAAKLALPILYDGEEEIDVWRERYRAGLAELAELRLDSPAAIGEALGAIAERTNFALPYQGRNDRQLQMQYGALVHRIAAAAFPQFAAPPVPQPKEKVRIGFVSAHFRFHTVARLFGGWLRGLEVRGFEVMALPTQTSDPASVAAAGCDVLIHLDIGMDPRAQVLAALRLAPSQYVTWGHPETTGLPTLDAFLSSDLMEPPDGESHYTERLIRLPNLSIDYPRPEVPDLPAREKAPVLLCSQSLFKLLPRFDALAARVVREVGDCRLEFVAHPSAAVTERFRKRIARAFRAAGVDEDRIHIHPRLAPADFLAVNQRADLLLDSLAWSGGNTTLEAVACGLPVVTLPGDLMRGRHASAILRRAGRSDLIARDEDDFVAIAARLARSRERLEGTGAVFGDPEPVATLADFLAS